MLSLGQVYPADLAISRRPLGFWLRNWPWERKTLRPHRALGEDRPWRVELESGGRILRAEVQSPRAPEESILAQAVRDMNRPAGEGGPC